MRISYLAAFIGTLIILFFTISKSYSSQKSIAKTLRKVLLAAVVATIANMVVIIPVSETVCMFAYSVFFVGMNWAMYYMMAFVMEYTNSENLMKHGPFVFGALLLADSVSMVCNFFTHHAFTATKMILDDGDVFYRLNYRQPYHVHLAITNLLIVLAIISLVVKIAKTPRIYRSKYIFILIILVFVGIADMIYVFLGGIIGVSIIGFAAGGVLMYYMSVIYVPKGLVDRLFTMVVHDMMDGVLLFDLDGNCIQANESAIALVEPEYRENAAEAFEIWYQKELQKQVDENGRDTVIKVENKTLYLRIFLKKLLDEDGAAIGAFIDIKNRTQEVNDLQAERYRATHDPLTGLYNKEFFYEKVRQRLDEQPEEQFILICSDIGNFKIVNDVFGMECGDRVLIRIARALHKMCKPDQIYGRIGNDGFALLMKKSDYGEEYFQNVPQSKVYVEKDIEYPIRLYLGVYEIVQKDLPVSGMCDRAKMAIATIKGNYQKRLAYYDEKLRQSVLNEQEIMGELDDAIASGQFHIYLQAQVNGQGESHGAEALVRWIHPKKGYLPPSAFIDILEKNGAIVRLDRYIWELACQKLREWTDEGREDMYLSVNISPKDFYFIDIYETFTSLVEQYGINPGRLHLEITETSVMTDVQQRIKIIERLQAYGFIVEMDDFGSGYSSLNMLKEIHVNVLKVDMVFLRKTTEMERSRKILRTIIALAQELGMETIVEGVETSEQLEFLKSISCDIFQGYYFAKPMEVSQFEEIYMR
ncbi:MAG: EAL domain-containing protein [Lachnobacterium sp.]|nr:EAL domain-containing protein [Lachnobacterium sp.]MDY5461963.1 EAL domain-containing protein [Agathobacter sp.]